MKDAFDTFFALYEISESRKIYNRSISSDAAKLESLALPSATEHEKEAILALAEEKSLSAVDLTGSGITPWCVSAGEANLESLIMYSFVDFSCLYVFRTVSRNPHDYGKKRIVFIALSPVHRIAPSL